EPLLPEEDWRAIGNYFKETAPVAPLPQPPHPPIRMDLKQFQVKEFKTRAGEPWTTMVKIDPAHQRLYIGDAQARSLDVLDSTGRLLKSVPVDSGPVSMIFKENGAYLTLIGKI